MLRLRRIIVALVSVFLLGFASVATAGAAAAGVQPAGAPQGSTAVASSYDDDDLGDELEDLVDDVFDDLEDILDLDDLLDL